MQNFVYLVGDPVARECVVVDPAWEIDRIVATAEADGMRLVGALVTHTHQDHVGGSLESWGMPGRIPGIEELLERAPVKVYVHRAEREFLRGFGSDLVKVDNTQTLQVGPAHPDVHAYARPHARLAMLPDRRSADLGRHALHRELRPHRPPGERSERDVLLAHPASRGPAGRHASPAWSQLRRPHLDDRRGEAPEPVSAVLYARGLLAGDGTSRVAGGSSEPLRCGPA